MQTPLFTLIENTLADKSQLLTDQQTLSAYLKSTEGFNLFEEKQRHLFAVIQITQTDEIKAMLDLANQCASNEELSFSLYPISTGLNWGYGTSQPAGLTPKIILLDLRRLNKITHFDNDLGIVTIEPGVTQQQLSDFLSDYNLQSPDDNQHQYMVPVTGAGPDCSILANAIERGYGITPHTDHFYAVTNLQGYWANGTPYQSAINELDGSNEKLTNKTFKWGLGPYLDGLFTQSNLGIVSQLTVRLAQKPASFTSFFIQLNDDNLLEKSVPLIRKILQDYDGIVGAINLMDQRRVISMFAKQPIREEAGNRRGNHQVMDDHQIHLLSKQLRTPKWTVVGSIYGSLSVVKAVQKDINALFKQIPCKRIYSNSLAINLANKLLKVTPNNLINKVPLLSTLSAQLTSFNKGKEIMLGKPNKVALNLCYWRNSKDKEWQERSLSPEKDGCGLLWYAPLIPMKVSKIREFVDFVRSTCPQYNIEPFITMTNLKHDCVDSTIPIVFDLNNPEAVIDAHNCLDVLVEEGLKRGFVPYRLNIDQQQSVLNKDSDFWQTVNKLKETLDPNHILSQGRYNPR